MAKFSYHMPVSHGPDDDFPQMYTVFETDSKDKIAITMAGAKVLQARLVEFLKPHKRTGALAASITCDPRESSGSVFVGPTGKHHGESTRPRMKEEYGYHRAKTGQGIGRTKKDRHHGLTAGISAVDVGYYLEVGTPRHPALHWMETTLEISGDEIQSAMETAWDEYLKSKGL
ncbi:MAG: hypothetical protein IJV41_00710 [Oscillospiraceae bacterium]|nr:hypothetical protein [Oscillospiraceae bacterium]